jgi:hypothetical protein
LVADEAKGVDGLPQDLNALRLAEEVVVAHYVEDIPRPSV